MALLKANCISHNDPTPSTPSDPPERERIFLLRLLAAFLKTGSKFLHGVGSRTNSLSGLETLEPVIRASRPVASVFPHGPVFRGDTMVTLGRF